METIIIALTEELAEIRKLVKKYTVELAKLPQGAFFTRKIKQKEYGYITYSTQGEIKQKYLGTMKEGVLEQCMLSM